MSQTIGFLAEEQARTYLVSQGLQWVESNFSSRTGEIDLIMQDKEHLVFVEVRKRASRVFGGAMASVTPHKQQKLLKTALYYLMVRQRQGQDALRFDVLGLEGVPAELIWIKNAFGSDY